MITAETYPTTASENVEIIDTAFAMPQLGKARRIWLYLPPGYHISKRKYPVIYMHDGQNLFDAYTSYCGEWGIDKFMNNQDDPCIIVAIDNAGLGRMNEYNPMDHEEHGPGEGEKYLDFIAHTLKPYIDKNYRTKKAAKYTAIAGSSMGGLITFYAGLYHPNVFGILGVFSPSFWINPLLTKELPLKIKRTSHRKQQYFFYAGGSEHVNMVKQMLEVSDLMKKLSKADIKVVVVPEGEHNESNWGMAFGRFYHWMLSTI